MANQEELVLKQFAAARNKLDQQKRAGLEEVSAQTNRQQALTGLSGGAAMKAAQKAQGKFVEASSGAEADLAANEAAALQNVKAKEEERTFASTEAEKGRQFQASQADIDRATQQEQFGKQFGESQSQFKQQMEYQWKEFNENVKTNLLNAAAAMKKAGIGNLTDASSFLNIVNYFRA